MMNRRELVFTALGSLSTATLSLRNARAFPDRPIRLVVPFSPGGATDVVGRMWAEKMKAILGTVVTENRGGGGGVIGATEVARAQPDGHTFLFGNTSTQVLIPAIMNNPPYDPLKHLHSLQRADLDRGPPVCASTQSPGADRVRQSQSRQVVIRLGRRGHPDQLGG